MRRSLALGVALSALLALPHAAQAERIGAHLSGESVDSPWSCASEPFCTFVQTKIEGDAIRAPFSGTITKWHVMQPSGSLRLQVLHRRDNGKFKAVRSSNTIHVASQPNQIKSFDTHLRIQKGDYVGVRVYAGFGASVGADGGLDNGFCFKGFLPGMEDGESAPPSQFGGACTWLLLYNATLQH
jgi:hypothetical protein